MIAPEPTSTYFGEMNYLSETDEFYTPVFFLPDFNEDHKDTLLPFLDSVVYQNEKISRRRLPMEVAKNTLMIMDMDSVFIFDTDHHFIFTADFLRIEYIEDAVDRRFVAIYKGGFLKGDPAEKYYCINKLFSVPHIPDFAYRTFVDKSLNKFIFYKLQGRTDLNWKIRHIEISPGQAIYSVITSPEKSMITELKDNQFRILKTLEGDYRIDDILPLPYEVNGLPLLLTSIYANKNRSPSLRLNVFTNYEEYKILPYNRLSGKR